MADYGILISNTATGSTRLVLDKDGGCTLQTLAVTQELTLTSAEVDTMLSALRAQAQHFAHSRWPRDGMVCACDQQAGVHVADARCCAEASLTLDLDEAFCWPVEDPAP